MPTGRLGVRSAEPRLRGLKKTHGKHGSPTPCNRPHLPPVFPALTPFSVRHPKRSFPTRRRTSERYLSPPKTLVLAIRLWLCSRLWGATIFLRPLFDLRFRSRYSKRADTGETLAAFESGLLSSARPPTTETIHGQDTAHQYPFDIQRAVANRHRSDRGISAGQRTLLCTRHRRSFSAWRLVKESETRITNALDGAKGSLPRWDRRQGVMSLHRRTMGRTDKGNAAHAATRETS